MKPRLPGNPPFFLFRILTAFTPAKHTWMSPLLILPACLALWACGKKQDDGSRLDKKAMGEKTIALIAGDSTSYWQGVLDGLQASSPNRLIWMATPPRTVQDQRRSIAEALELNLYGILMEPLETLALQADVYKALDKKIPVVFVNQMVTGVRWGALLTTDETRTATLAARRLSESMNGRGMLMILPSAKHPAMDSAVMETLNALSPGIKIPLWDAEAVNREEEAFQLAEKLLILYPQTRAIYAGNPDLLMGGLRALRDIQKTGSVALVGRGYRRDFKPALEAGEIQGLVVSDAQALGREARRLMDRLAQTPDTLITASLPPVLLTPENYRDLKFAHFSANDSDVVVIDP